MANLIRFLLLTICCLAWSGPAGAGKQEELENLRQRISALQQELDKTADSKAEAADALRASERAISDSNRRLAELSVQQRTADGELRKLHVQSLQLRTNIGAQQTLLGKMLRRQYQGGQRDYLKLLLNNQDPNRLAREFAYYRYIARDRADWLAALRKNLATLTAISNSTREHRAQLEALRTEQVAQTRDLEQEQRTRQQILGKISGQLRQQRREIKRLQRNENRLAQLVDRLTRMLAKPRTGSLFRNDQLPDDRFDGVPFDQLRGKLVLPVKGEITNAFGTERPNSTLRWKGLFLKAASGQPVKAIAAGRVVFADWLRGFGNLLIVDHGKSYMSLYAYNETLYKQVGDILHGGDTIATVGNSGGNEDSGLYFELRHESKPLNPVKWLAPK